MTPNLRTTLSVSVATPLAQFSNFIVSCVTITKINTMILNKETVDAYETILNNPSEYGLPIKPITEWFEECEEVTAKHELFEQLVNAIQRPMPKVIFYILMDKMYPSRIGNDSKGCAGYGLRLVLTPATESSAQMI